MSGLLDEAGRLQLPARIRARSAPEDGFSSRLTLADRIAELPDIHTIERSLDTLPCSADVFLCKLAPSGRKQRPAVLLCSISRDGIAVHGLGDWDRYQVLCNGWGKLHRDRVLIFLPRDERELEVCWHILQSAYRLLSEASAVAPPQRMTSPWDLPRFSRTPLQ
jgi:hypothetical protein